MVVDVHHETHAAQDPTDDAVAHGRIQTQNPAGKATKYAYDVVERDGETVAMLTDKWTASGVREGEIPDWKRAAPSWTPTAKNALYAEVKGGVDRFRVEQ